MKKTIRHLTLRTETLRMLQGLGDLDLARVAAGRKPIPNRLEAESNPGTGDNCP